MQSQASGGADRVEWFHTGEIVVVARVARGTSEQQLRDTMGGLLGRHAREHLSGDPGSLRSFVFDAPGQARSLAFVFQKLAERDSVPAVKGAVETLHANVPNLRTGALEVLGVMPHWHTRAHEMSSGASPGSRPAPVFPDQVRRQGARRWRYRPVDPRISPAGQQASAPVRVAVLDTRVDLAQARARAEQLRETAHNHQLLETIEWLEHESVTTDPSYADEWQEIAQHHHHLASSDAPEQYPMPDHGLFVAGLIHGLAPRAPLTFLPVLDDKGVGDLYLLLAALQQVLSRKRQDEPQIINLSLGFRPHPAHVPAAWHGLERPHDPSYARAPVMFDAARGPRWVAEHRGDVRRQTELLQAGLSELGEYLSLNNCLVVAAAGNDSLESRHRLEPRLPARFETVLGVAATTSDPNQPAPYSNIGDEQRLGDHVATFGGSVGDEFQPRDGVVGIYSGEFPSGQANDTGWAYWSGTSFATALVAGMAANFWAHRRRDNPRLHAVDVLADIHDAAAESGPYVPELRTPSIEVAGGWEE
jgi:hypothetical protein